MHQESYLDLQERNRRARELRKQGHKVMCHTLRNQQMWDGGYGLPREARPGFKVASVYMVTWLEGTEQ